MNLSRSHASIKQITDYADKHQYKPFTPVDSAIIAILGHSHFSLLDLTMVTVRDLVKPSGKLVDCCCYGTGKKTKLLRVSGYISDILEVTMQWRLNHGFSVTEYTEFNGLDPDSRFFLDANGAQFGVVKTDKGGSISYEPSAMRKRFKTYSLPVDWTPNTLNDSFLYHLWREISVTKPSAAIKILEQATGLNPKTIKQKIFEEPVAVHEALALVY